MKTICNTFTKQPTLLLLDNAQIILKLDNELIELEGGFTNALDILFKSFWVFQVEYPETAANIYYFIERCLNIKTDKSRSKVNEIFDLLNSN